MIKGISDFKSNFAGGARPNLFEVALTFPNEVRQQFNANTFSTLTPAQTTMMMVKGASLPSSVVGTIPLKFRGRELKIAGDRTYETWTITVINDTGMELRNMFEAWMDLIARNSANVSAYDNLDYMTQLNVSQLNGQGQQTKTYTIKDAYPINIQAIELSYDTTDAIEEFTVEFNYQYWTSGESGVIEQVTSI